LVFVKKLKKTFLKIGVSFRLVRLRRACPESFFVVLPTNACNQKDSRRASLAGMTFTAGIGFNHISMEKGDFNLNMKEEKITNQTD
jgi:hypothetical protein